MFWADVPSYASTLPMVMMVFGFELPTIRWRTLGTFSVAVTFMTDSQALEGGNDEWFKNTGLVDSNSLGFSQDWGISLNASGQVGCWDGIGIRQAHDDRSIRRRLA